MQNRNCENEIETSSNMLVKIAQNNATLLTTASNFIATQTYDQINVNKINYINPPNNTISLGSILSGSSSVVIGKNSKGSDNVVCVGTSSGDSNPASVNNVYLGNNITHLGNASFTNSIAIGNSIVLNDSNIIALGNSTQTTKITKPSITNMPILDYVTFNNPIYSQVGYHFSTTKTGIFQQILQQNLAFIVCTVGKHLINYSISINPNPLTTILSGADVFHGFGFSLSETNNSVTDLQFNSILTRVDYQNPNVKSMNTNVSYSCIVTNTGLIDKVYYLNTYNSTIDVRDLTQMKYTIKMESVRIC